MSAAASVVDANTEEEAARIVGEIADPLGTFYRFGLPRRCCTGGNYSCRGALLSPFVLRRGVPPPGLQMCPPYRFI